MPVFASLAAGRLDRIGYIALLRRLYGFHAPMEAAIACGLAGEPAVGDWPEWRRAALLRQDMGAMGVAEDDIGRLPLLAEARLGDPGLRGPPAAARALGWLYVVEGSTLGGRLLARRLDHILPDNTPCGRVFLLAGGARDHVSWTRVCQVIDRVGSDPGRLATMTEAAAEAFRLFEEWFGAAEIEAAA
jgi:heme oxygenase